MRLRSLAPRGIVIISVMLAALAPALLTAGEAQPAKEAEPNPMAPFERLVGGRWHIGRLQHSFEWGVAKRTVIARTYAPNGVLSSEARWFWHPGEKVIKGYSIDAAGGFFAEMTTSFEGDVLKNRVLSFEADGKQQLYTGIWRFTDRDHYDWKLYQETGGGRKQVMAMSAERKE